MENIDEGKLKAQVTRNRVYKAIGQLLKLFASSAEISHNRFYRLLADSLYPETGLEISPETIKRYTNRGIPQSLSYSRLSNAIEQAYQSYISDPECTDKEKSTAKEAHDSHYPELLSTMKELYRVIQLVDECEPFLETELRMKQTIIAFLGGTLFNEGETPSQKDLDWLRESFRQFPPKGIEVPK